MKRKHSSQYLRGFPGLLRRIADRLDDRGAPKIMSYSFTIEPGEGIRFREDGYGCPIAHIGADHYVLAHIESDAARAYAEQLTAERAEAHDA